MVIRIQYSEVTNGERGGDDLRTKKRKLGEDNVEELKDGAGGERGGDDLEKTRTKKKRGEDKELKDGEGGGDRPVKKRKQKGNGSSEC